MKGYLQQWHNAKVLYGCTLFRDLLKPAEILCVALQNDEFPTVKKVIGAIQQSNDGEYHIMNTANQF